MHKRSSFGPSTQALQVCLRARTRISQILATTFFENLRFYFQGYSISNPLRPLGLYVPYLNRFLSLMHMFRKTQFAFPFQKLSKKLSYFYWVVKESHIPSCVKARLLKHKMYCITNMDYSIGFGKQYKGSIYKVILYTTFSYSGLLIRGLEPYGFLSLHFVWKFFM